MVLIRLKDECKNTNIFLKIRYFFEKKLILVNCCFLQNNVFFL